jgi:DNA-binding response OmpR family regulator
MRILLLSADRFLQNNLYRQLSSHSFLVDLATDGETAWGMIEAFIYDLVLLEAVLPNLNGIDLCRRLRNVGNPVLILMITNTSEDSIHALDMGADSCLVKPIQKLELLAHIRALSRRDSRRASPLLSWGPLLLNPTARQVTCHGQVLKINRKEYQLLELFLRHPRQMFPHSEISDRLWTLDEQIPTDATIRTHIRSIRRKLEQVGIQDLIQTHYGQGYCLNPTYDSSTNPPDLALNQQPKQPMVDTIAANLWQELMAANARLHQEIEHRRQIEDQLRSSEMMLRNAQRVAQIGCWNFDINTRETYWTEELYLIHGLDPNRPAPNYEEILTLIHPDDLQIHEEAIRVPALRGKAFEANLRIVRTDGEVRYINARGGPILDSSGKVIKLTGTTFDLTRWIKNID